MLYLEIVVLICVEVALVKPTAFDASEQCRHWKILVKAHPSFGTMAKQNTHFGVKCLTTRNSCSRFQIIRS